MYNIYASAVYDICARSMYDCYAGVCRIYMQELFLCIVFEDWSFFMCLSNAATHTVMFYVILIKQKHFL